MWRKKYEKKLQMNEDEVSFHVNNNLQRQILKSELTTWK